MRPPQLDSGLSNLLTGLLSFGTFCTDHFWRRILPKTSLTLGMEFFIGVELRGLNIIYASMRIAYFINQYPAVSHTFIRREIRALEELAVTVVRIALQPASVLGDQEDEAEARQTKFLLAAGIGEILRSTVGAVVRRPIATISIVGRALVLGRRSDTGIIRHLGYVVEALVLANWCRHERIQHIHAHFGTNSATIAMLASQLCRIPYSFTAHGPDEFEKAPLLSLDEKLEHARFVACVSSFGRSQFMRWSAPKNWHKIEVVHCGLDRKFFNEPLRPPPEAPRLVCIGTLNDRKGQILLVAAASRLRKQGVRCEIAIIGDGEMRPAIERAIRRAGLEDAISLIGWASGERVISEIQAARAMVLPSFSENLPVVLMEAMALGRPVISTYVAGIPELVEPGKTGWLIPAGDEVALAEAMREALATPITQLAAMGVAGQRRILDHHDVLKEANKLKWLFERSIQSQTTIATVSAEVERSAKNQMDISPKERLILHFHGLGPVPPWADLKERQFWCGKDRFASILDTICTLSQVARIEITFDDGNASDANIALPALVDRGLTATFFVCAGRIGLPGYLDASAINDLISGGMEVGSHGWGHVDWRRVDDKVLDLEVDDARLKIADIVGSAIDKISIPFGSYDRRILLRLRRSNARSIFTSDGGRAPLSGWMLPREVFKSSWDDDNRTLRELATNPLPLAAGLRRATVSYIKRWR